MSGTTGDTAKCRALLLELSRYLDDELTPDRCLEIERHIDSCECCATMAGRLRETMDACRAARDLQLPADVRARAAARIKTLLEG